METNELTRTLSIKPVYGSAEEYAAYLKVMSRDWESITKEARFLCNAPAELDAVRAALIAKAEAVKIADSCIPINDVCNDPDEMIAPLTSAYEAINGYYDVKATHDRLLRNIERAVAHLEKDVPPNVWFLVGSLVDDKDSELYVAVHCSPDGFQYSDIKRSLKLVKIAGDYDGSLPEIKQGAIPEGYPDIEFLIW